MSKPNKNDGQVVSRVPKLRFEGFEGDWSTSRFDDLYTFKVTNSLSRENLNYECGTVKNIHYGDIHTKFCTLFNIKNEKVRKRPAASST